MSRCNVTSGAILRVASLCATTLTYLDISGCRITNPDDWHTLAVSLPHLRHINVCDCPHFIVQHLRRFLQNCHQLTEVVASMLPVAQPHLGTLIRESKELSPRSLRVRFLCVPISLHLLFIMHMWFNRSIYYRVCHRRVISIYTAIYVIKHCTHHCTII